MGFFILYKERKAFIKEPVKQVKTQAEINFEKEQLALGAIKILGKNLKQELKAALKVSVLNALSVCNTKASIITQKSKAQNIQLGRVSQMNRNPNNSPKDWMLPYMERFKNGEIKDAYIKVSIGSKHGILKPIFTAPMCLKCHGENIDSTISSKIQELYPFDKATGFEVGDIRGYFFAEYY